MSAHSCTTLTPGCYRCDLNKDEIRGWIESLVVTHGGVVHEANCPYLRGTFYPHWHIQRCEDDRACKHCLDGELPDLAVIA